MEELILLLVAAAILGVILAEVYLLSHSRAVIARQMATSLIVYTILSAMMLYLKLSIAGVAVIGAVTLMRFRNPSKDHRDFLFVFWAIVNGFCLAANQFLLLVTGDVIVILLLCLLGAVKKDERLLLIVRSDYGEEEDILDMISEEDKKIRLRYNNSMEGEYSELIYEVLCKENNLEWACKLKKRLYEQNGVKEVNLVYQKDDMGI